MLSANTLKHNASVFMLAFVRVTEQTCVTLNFQKNELKSTIQSKPRACSVDKLLNLAEYLLNMYSNEKQYAHFNLCWLGPEATKPAGLHAGNRRDLYLPAARFRSLQQRLREGARRHLRERVNNNQYQQVAKNCSTRVYHKANVLLFRRDYAIAPEDRLPFGAGLFLMPPAHRRSAAR